MVDILSKNGGIVLVLGVCVGVYRFRQTVQGMFGWNPDIDVHNETAMPTDDASGGPNEGKYKWKQGALLSWHKKSNLWRKRKRINGKPVDFYFKHPNTEVGYRRALKEWRKEEKQIIAQQKQEGDSQGDFLAHICFSSVGHRVDLMSKSLAHPKEFRLSGVKVVSRRRTSQSS